MAGYAQDFSMSNNAIAAYRSGLAPASKISGIPAALIRRFCRPDEWHHASKAFNRVDFYDVARVRTTFGLEQNPDHDADPDAIAALAEHKASKGKPDATTYSPCRVNWLEWRGTLKNASATERSELGCTVTVKGQTAYVTLPNGQMLTKRITTRGFSFSPE